MAYAAQKFAFLSFLDLISCAFGSAVLIFIVSAAIQQESGGQQQAKLLFVYVHPVSGAAQELDFEIRDPDGVRRLSSEPLPNRWKRFATPAKTGGGSCLVINAPSPGQWRFRVYWTNGAFQANSAGKLQLEIFCPDGVPNQRESIILELAGNDRFTKEVPYTIGTLVPQD